MKVKPDGKTEKPIDRNPISSSSGGSHRRYSIKKGVLRISQNSQENTCARVSFSIKLQALGLSIDHLLMTAYGPVKTCFFNRIYFFVRWNVFFRCLLLKLDVCQTFVLLMVRQVFVSASNLFCLLQYDVVETIPFHLLLHSY